MIVVVAHIIANIPHANAVLPTVVMRSSLALFFRFMTVALWLLYLTDGATQACDWTMSSNGPDSAPKIITQFYPERINLALDS